MKSGIRYIAIASGPKSGKSTMLIGAIFRDNYMEGLLSTRIDVDGMDSTKKIIGMINRSRFKEQIRIILLNGIALAGLNIIDPSYMEKKLGIRVMLLNRRRQNPKELIKALRGFSRLKGIDVSKRIATVKEYSKVDPLKVNGIYIQSRLEKGHIRSFSEKAFEALRIAHIIARGVSTGESKGRI